MVFAQLSNRSTQSREVKSFPLAGLGLLNLQQMLLCETAEKTISKEIPRGAFTNTAMAYQWVLVDVVSCFGKSRINPITFWGRRKPRTLLATSCLFNFANVVKYYVLGNQWKIDPVFTGSLGSLS